MQQLTNLTKMISLSLGHLFCQFEWLDKRSTLMFLRRLAPHYSNIRKIVNMLYNVRRVDKELSTLDRALYTGDVCLLQDFYDYHYHSYHHSRIIDHHI